MKDHNGSVSLEQCSENTAVVRFEGKIIGHYSHPEGKVLLTWATPHELREVAGAITYLCCGEGALLFND